MINAPLPPLAAAANVRILALGQCRGATPCGHSPEMHPARVIGHTYIFVQWKHSSADEPAELWSELDERRFEVRKLEVWADGRVGYADEDQEAGGTRLGIEPLPALDEIASDPQFELSVISQLDFEQQWNVRADSHS